MRAEEINYAEFLVEKSRGLQLARIQCIEQCALCVVDNQQVQN